MRKFSAWLWFCFCTVGCLGQGAVIVVRSISGLAGVVELVAAIGFAFAAGVALCGLMEGEDA